VVQPYLPLPLVLIQQPFDHPDYLFDVKYDGWRCLAFSNQAGVRLVSRRARSSSGFATLAKDLQAALRGKEAVIGGEIAWTVAASPCSTSCSGTEATATCTPSIS
jgi:ATP-dependent DNA ligase